MEYDNFSDSINPKTIEESLRLPPMFDEATYETTLDIDILLKQDETPVATLNAKVTVR